MRQENRALLNAVMGKHGFAGIEGEIPLKQVNYKPRVPIHQQMRQMEINREKEFQEVINELAKSMTGNVGGR